MCHVIGFVTARLGPDRPGPAPNMDGVEAAYTYY